jgi:hypothetical protein
VAVHEPFEVYVPDILTQRPSPTLLWLLTEKSGSLVTELKDKLRSKVDTAKFFLGALAVNAGLLVNTNLWSTAGPGTHAFLLRW